MKDEILTEIDYFILAHINTLNCCECNQIISKRKKGIAFARRMKIFDKIICNECMKIKYNKLY